MARNAVTDWDINADNNTDIAGINIAEGWSPADVNNAFRAMMAQLASYITGLVLKSGAVMTGALTRLGNASTILDATGAERGLGYRALPLQTARTSASTLALTDVGTGIPTTAAVTVPANATTAFASGDSVIVLNRAAANLALTPASGVTFRLPGTTATGARTIGPWGYASLLKVGTDEWLVAGPGVS